MAYSGPTFKVTAAGSLANISPTSVIACARVEEYIPDTAIVIDSQNHQFADDEVAYARRLFRHRHMVARNVRHNVLAETAEPVRVLGIFTQDQLGTLRGALQCAINKYRENIKLLKEDKTATESAIAAGQTVMVGVRLIEATITEFERCVTDAEHMLELIGD